MTVWEDRKWGDDVPPWRRTAAAAASGVADVVEGLRNVATLKGVLPFGSVDARAVDRWPLVGALPGSGGWDGQEVRFRFDGSHPALVLVWDEQAGRWVQVSPPPVVTTLPASGVRFPGMQVLYRHTAGQVPWLCIWDPALNGGAGAWAVHSATPLQSVQTSSGTRTTNGAVPNLPALSIPVSGLWVIEAFGSVRQSANAALQDCEIRVTVNGADVPSNIVSVTQSQVWVGGSVHGREGASGRVLSAGNTIGLTVAAGLNGTVTWNFGDKRVWHILATPMELRP